MLEAVSQTLASLLVLLMTATPSAVGVPAGFPLSANGLWYKSPGTSWVKELLPIGNGFLAAMVPGGTSTETTQLNIESLWSGGPFEDSSYNGGNMPPSTRTQMAQDMQRIRETIFSNGTIDEIEELCTDPGAYGSYSGAGYLVTTLGPTGEESQYGRWLDLDQALISTTWTANATTFVRTFLCSHAMPACFQHIVGTTSSSTSTKLPIVTYSFSNALEDGLPSANVTCFDNSTLQVEGNIGMAYEFLFRARAAGADAKVSCQSHGTGNATLTISNASEAWVTWVGDTEYDMEAGDPAHNFTFSKPLPEVHQSLVTILDTATGFNKTIENILSEHINAYRSNLGDLSLTLGNQNVNISVLASTDELKAAYRTDVGDVYLEWLLFNFGRYLLASSAPGRLPANLQGKWALNTSNPWSADYHSNINIQMNYWFAEMTGMPATVTTPLFDYIEKTWAPRGAETALTLYNITRGWVTHDEMNIFGHTGMKLSGNSAQWADYPESAVWMMVHVFDHFDYTQDLNWWRTQGWPLLKGVASFHLDKLIPDTYHNDTTIVVAPCNSPEQIPITLGCAHAQQLIWQMFNAVEKGWAASGDDDDAFLQEVQNKRSQMDKGVHIGSWGQLQEWKIDMDSPLDTHRHLSHLIGLYPGYALTSYDQTLQGPPSSVNQKAYTKEQVLNATTTSLIHRGNGTAPDGDAGWEKVWRAASWAQLGNAQAYYHQLTYAVERNYGPNLFSLYDPLDTDPIFQIDANLGYPAAVLNALIQAPDVASNTAPLIITLLPALPSAWGAGSLKNVHLRRGITLDLDWSGGRPSNVTLKLISGGTQSSEDVTVIFGDASQKLTLEAGKTYHIDT